MMNPDSTEHAYIQHMRPGSIRLWALDKQRHPNLPGRRPSADPAAAPIPTRNPKKGFG